MACTNFPNTGLVANVTTHTVGEILYKWTGSVWEAVSPPVDFVNNLSLPYVFDTVADMTASDIAFPVGKRLETKGYYAKGDGGDGDYIVVAAATGTVDGGSYHNLTGGGQAELVCSSSISGRQFGMAFDGVTDDTLAFQSLVSASVTLNKIALLDSGSTLITDSISCVRGTRMTGVKGDQYNDGFGQTPTGTIVLFEPTTSKSLFVTDGASSAGFRFHYYIANMFIEGNANANECFDLNGVIYSSFENMAIKGFDIGISGNATINNRLENILITDCRNVAVNYEGGTETTDMWSQCSFFATPIGVQFNGVAIGMKFHGCLFEQLNKGVIIHSQCQTISFVDCYSEDIAFDGVATGCMFEVGFDGAAAVLENHLTIIGGKYQGRNAGIVGSFLKSDFANGIVVSGVNVTRWSIGISATVNTRDNSIILGGIAAKSITTQIDNFDKVNGLYPHANIEDAGGETRVINDVALFNEIRQRGSFGLQVAKIGEKLSFYGGTPVVQPNSTGETAGFVAGGGVAATSASTATGNLGTTAYRHSDIVKALKQVGILAL